MPAEGTYSSTHPAHGGFSITPDDSDELTRITRGIYVGVAGDVKVDFANGDTVTFTDLAAGVIHAIAVRKVYSTGTAATNIVGIF